MSDHVKLESGWLLKQLDIAEQRANDLPYWLTHSTKERESTQTSTVKLACPARDSTNSN